MIDTCQANTMYSQFYSPNILATGSSEIEENSYSVCFSFNPVLPGLIISSTRATMILACLSSTVIRTLCSNSWKASIRRVRFPSRTWYALSLDAALSDALTPFKFSSYDPAVIRSHAGVRSDLFRRSLDKTRITDFFGGVSQAEVFPPAQENAQTVLPENIRPAETSQRAAIPPENVHYNPDGVRDNAALPSLESESEAWDTRWKDVRKWTSILLVASLVTWVSFA